MKNGRIYAFALIAAISAVFAVPSFASETITANSNVTRNSDVNCSNILEKLKDLRTSTQSVGSEVVRIVNDSAQVMASWYGQLSSYQGQTVYIPYGTYDSINQSSVIEARNAVTFQTDFDTLDSNLADILVALPNCLKGSH